MLIQLTTAFSDRLILLSTSVISRVHVKHLRWGNMTEPRPRLVVACTDRVQPEFILPVDADGRLDHCTVDEGDLLRNFQLFVSANK